MGTRKGHFTKDDADRYTEKHLEICKWFIYNGGAFIRGFLFDNPVGKIDVILEKLVTSPTGYIIGYADVLLSYRTDQGKDELVLIEVKTSLGDQAEALRQLNTYQQYLPEITKKCLVHADWRFKPWLDEGDGEGLRDDADMRQTYSSQGIYVVEYESLQHNGGYNPHYCAFPSGRREVFVDWDREVTSDYGLKVVGLKGTICFNLRGVGVDTLGEAREATGGIFFRPPFPSDLRRLFGIKNADGDFKQVQNFPCLIDVEHHACREDGSAQTEYVAIHTCDLSVSIQLKSS